MAAVGLALLVGMIAYMAYHALAQESPVPSVRVDPVGAERQGSRYVVRFRARNASDATAAALQIEGELRRGERTVETSQATLDYLPPYSEREGGLYFENDPSRYELHLLPKGYVTP